MRSSRIVLSLSVLLAIAAGCSPTDLQSADPASVAGKDSVGKLATSDGPLSMKAITPTSGAVDGDTVVLIKGSGFMPGMKVRFGDMEAKDVRVVSDEILTAAVPSQQESTVDVSLEATIDSVPRIAGQGAAYQYVLTPRSNVDTDGDGLTDAQEIAGWKITVDYFGFGTSGNESKNLITYTVTSDPTLADTDGDGLND